MSVPDDEETGALLDTTFESNSPPLNEFDDEDDDPPTLPRFLQDQGEYRHWKWLPPRFRGSWKRIKTWIEGPQPPRTHRIEPWFPDFQKAPVRLLNHYLPKRDQKILLLIVFYILWAITFGLIFGLSSRSDELGEYGKPYSIGCGNTFWSPANRCDLDGMNCRPFENTSMAFSCPGECASRWILNPRAVGAQEVNYRSFVIGGASINTAGEEGIYRGDSFICGAAVHAGVIDNAAGGCGVVTLVGNRQGYDSTKRHGITSIPFDSYFPLSFKFQPGISCATFDPRWLLLAVSLAYMIPFSLFTASGPVYFWTIFTGVFIHVGFASDPPNHSSTAGLVSNLLGKLLPAAFCAFVIYRYIVIRTLSNLEAQVEKTVFWLGGVWLGALSNITLDWIPIQRLNAHDLKQQPGAPLALAVIICILLVVVIQQILAFRSEGRLSKYLGIYGLFVLAILLSLLIPGLNLRIHHYILALLLLPGTSMQTRPVLFYQGLLIGLFINGIARWGFDSVLQTSAELLGDGQRNSLLPVVHEPIINLGMPSNITFSWEAPSKPYDGFSVLVNDVERFRGFVDEGFGHGRSWTWNREQGLNVPEYFRFGYMRGNRGFDFSRAGTWNLDGSWTEMEPGASRVNNHEMGVDEVLNIDDWMPI